MLRRRFTYPENRRRPLVAADDISYSASSTYDYIQESLLSKLRQGFALSGENHPLTATTLFRYPNLGLRSSVVERCFGLF